VPSLPAPLAARAERWFGRPATVVEITELSPGLGEGDGDAETDGPEAELAELPSTIAIREGRPVHQRLWMRPDEGEPLQVDASAIPLIGAGGCHGALVYFWPTGGSGG